MLVESLKKDMKSSFTIKLTKYLSIQQILKEYTEMNLDNGQISLKKNQIELLNPQNNYIHYYCSNSINAINKIDEIDEIDEIDDEFLESQNINNYLYLEIMMYYSWFPHVMTVILVSNDCDICKILYYIISENKKPNARNWDIFINANQKLKITFDEFLFYLISKESIVKNCFLTTEQMKYFNCNICQNKKIIPFSDNLNICYNFQRRIYIKNSPYAICQMYNV
jgi:hypothetical protein